MIPQQISEDSNAAALISDEMVEAGFLVLAKSGIADEYAGADKLLVQEIFRAMLEATPWENLKSPNENA